MYFWQNSEFLYISNFEKIASCFDRSLGSCEFGAKNESNKVRNIDLPKRRGLVNNAIFLRSSKALSIKDDLST